MTTAPKEAPESRAVRGAAAALKCLIAATGAVLCGGVQAQIDFSGINKYRDNQRQQVEGGWRPPGGRSTAQSAADAEEEAWAKRAAEQSRDEAARVQRQHALWRELDTQAGLALDRSDYHEALRLLKALQASHRDAYASSPRVTDAIARTEALLAWSEAKTSGDYRRAIAMKPAVFSAANIAYVERLEDLERDRRERPEREAAARAATAKMGATIDDLVSSLAAPSPPARKTIDGSRAVTPDGGFQAPRSAPNFVADDSTSDEHAAVAGALGFDMAGPLAAKIPPRPPPPVARPVLDPALEKHPAVQKLAECRAKADESKLSAAAASARLEDEVSVSPDSSAIIMLRVREEKARSQAAGDEHAVQSQIEEVEKMITFGTF